MQNFARPFDPLDPSRRHRLTGARRIVSPGPGPRVPILQVAADPAPGWLSDVAAVVDSRCPILVYCLSQHHWVRTDTRSRSGPLSGRSKNPEED